MGGGFDYSKWDKLELSDDEDDHPGAQFIEANTLRRIKRQSHEQKTEEKNQKIQSLMGEMKDALKTIAAVKHDAGDAPLTEEQELATRAAQEKHDAARAAIDAEERERKFNAEEWCHVSNTFDRSLVGAACVADEGEEELEYEPYVKKYGEQLEEVARANFNDYADMAEHFQLRTHLLTEHSMGWMLLKCLFLEMDGKRDEMRIAAKVGYALKCVLDFAEAGGKTMKDAARPFFTRLATHPEVLTEYHKSLDDYVDKRAKEKKLEEEAEKFAAQSSLAQAAAIDEVPREERLGPGGLDPVEVFDSLPKEMQDAFESGDVAKLREFVNGLSMDEARHHMRRMVDAGLWVPKPGEEGSALQPGPDATEEDEEEEEEEEKDA